jgi:hypothetical protein
MYFFFFFYSDKRMVGCTELKQEKTSCRQLFDKNWIHVTVNHRLRRLTRGMADDSNLERKKYIYIDEKKIVVLGLHFKILLDIYFKVRKLTNIRYWIQTWDKKKHGKLVTYKKSRSDDFSTTFKLGRILSALFYSG